MLCGCWYFLTHINSSGIRTFCMGALFIFIIMYTYCRASFLWSRTTYVLYIRTPKPVGRFRTSCHCIRRQMQDVRMPRWQPGSPCPLESTRWCYRWSCEWWDSRLMSCQRRRLPLKTSTSGSRAGIEISWLDGWGTSGVSPLNAKCSWLLPKASKYAISS